MDSRTRPGDQLSSSGQDDSVDHDHSVDPSLTGDLNAGVAGTRVTQREGLTLAASFANLSGALDALAGVAPVSQAEDLLALLPAGTIDARRLVLRELLKGDMAAAARAGQPRDLDFYWPTVESILPSGQVRIELVLECVRHRTEQGLEVDWEKYGRVFPKALDSVAGQQAGPDGVGTHVLNDVPREPTTDSLNLLQGGTYDDFTIIRQLGSGSFATVYLARQESMHRLVALKVSSRNSDEPRALSQLDHANIVRVYDQRWLRQPPASLLYMQYIAGGTLAECIKQLRTIDRERWNGGELLNCIDRALVDAYQNRPEHSSTREQIAGLEWPSVVAWLGGQIAEGLDYADRRGVLHRDIKPANILLTGEGIPKLADFNVSATDTAGESSSWENFGGSLGYMSPEQLRVADPDERMPPGHLDVRSDLYALGLMLWELWQGERPWKPQPCDGMSAAIREQRALRSQPIVARHPAHSPAERILEKVLRSVLQVDREQRPRSGQEVAARLKLSLHPELARRFEPVPGSMAERLRRTPMLLLAALVIFLPNVAASVFNYWYNWWRMAELKSVIATIESDFKLVADWVNGIVFPLGGVLFLLMMVPTWKLVCKGAEGGEVSAKEMEWLWNIGKLATLICVILWVTSGVVFAGAFAWMHGGQFQADDAFHFFMSLFLCGGVAAIYPYFGMTLLAVLLYYPQVVAPRMIDVDFDRRAARLLRDSTHYLLLAAGIPLTAVALLVLREQVVRGYVLLGTAVTLVGLLAAFDAHRRLERGIREYARIFSRH